MPASEFLTQLLEERTKEALEEGLEQGREVQARKSLELVLRQRFSRIPRPVLNRLRKLKDIEKLQELIRRAAVAESMEEFRRRLR